MRIGLIGCGNMARALARGWGRPVACFDPWPTGPRRLAEELGGRAMSSNREVADDADLLVLAHKPAQLRDVAAELGEGGQGAPWPRSSRPPRWRTCGPPTRTRACTASCPRCPWRCAAARSCRRADPAAARRATAAPGSTELDDAVTALFGELGMLVLLDESLVDVAMGLMSCAPAYVALVAEAQIDAGVRRGIPAAQGARLVVETLAGTAELLRSRGYDTVAVRREVTSPGGVTARGLDALERGGVRAAFSDALDAVLR